MKKRLYACIIASIACTNAHVIAHDTQRNDLLLSPEEPVSNDSLSDCNQLQDLNSSMRQPEKHQLHVDQIHEYAKQFVQKHSSKHKRLNNKDKATYHKAQEMAKNICGSLCTQLKKSNLETVSKQHIDRTLNIALSNFFTAPTILPKNLISSVDSCIEAFFKENATSVQDVPHAMKKEFFSRRESIIQNFKTDIEQRSNERITVDETQTSVKNTYEGFVLRMKYVLQAIWINASLLNLKKDDPSKTPSSYLIPNHEAKKFREKLKFLDKK